MDYICVQIYGAVDKSIAEKLTIFIIITHTQIRTTIFNYESNAYDNIFKIFNIYKLFLKERKKPKKMIWRFKREVNKFL